MFASTRKEEPLYQEGWNRSTAKETAMLQDLARPCWHGPQLQISTKEAKQAREICRLILSRKNLLEMQHTLPSCLTPFIQACLQKEQRERVVWEAKRTQPLAHEATVGARLTDCYTEYPFAYLDSSHGFLPLTQCC